MINKCYTRYCSDSYRSNCPEVFCKKGVLRSYAKFTGKYLYQSLFFNKVAGMVAASVVRRNKKHKKDENTRMEWKEIWKKSNGNRVSCLNIYIVVFAFLLNTTEVGRWWKLNEMLAFGMLFICYVYLLRLLRTFLWKFFKNNAITFVWQLFLYFYQISNKFYWLMFLIDLLFLDNYK